MCALFRSSPRTTRHARKGCAAATALKVEYLVLHRAASLERPAYLVRRGSAQGRENCESGSSTRVASRPVQPSIESNEFDRQCRDHEHQHRQDGGEIARQPALGCGHRRRWVHTGTLRLALGPNPECANRSSPSHQRRGTSSAIIWPMVSRRTSFEQPDPIDRAEAVSIFGSGDASVDRAPGADPSRAPR